MGHSLAAPQPLKKLPEMHVAAGLAADILQEAKSVYVEQRTLQLERFLNYG